MEMVKLHGTPCNRIQAIVDNVSTNTNGNNVDQMDEEELSQVILLCKGLKFKVTPTNIITNVTFT